MGKYVAADRQKELFSFETKVPEKQITQENRQLAFDNYQIDNLEYITGITKTNTELNIIL